MRWDRIDPTFQVQISEQKGGGGGGKFGLNIGVVSAEASGQGEVQQAKATTHTVKLTLNPVTSQGGPVEAFILSSPLPGTTTGFIETLAGEVNLEMIAIPGGEFLMGSPEGKGDSDEKPQHQVSVPPFYLGRYPVTQAQWRIVAGWDRVSRDIEPDPSGFKGDRLPVERVFWEDAVEFCARLRQRFQRDYTLPSEAQWEYACRAGTTTPFHFGATLNPDVANYNSNFTYGQGSKGRVREKTTPVGSLGAANP